MNANLIAARDRALSVARELDAHGDKGDAAAITLLIAAANAVLAYQEGEYDNPRLYRGKGGVCRHGAYYWQPCEDCIDEHFEMALAPRCGICSRRLDTPSDPSSANCGGDCRRCLAEAGDPDCGT